MGVLSKGNGQLRAVTAVPVGGISRLSQLAPTGILSEVR